jgi:hypothetical protein
MQDREAVAGSIIRLRKRASDEHDDMG